MNRLYRHPPEQSTEHRTPRLTSARIAVMYAAAATAWIVFSDLVLARVDLPATTAQFVNSIKGIAFVAVTATLFFLLLSRYLTKLGAAEYELRSQEVRIREAYVDVLDAVTGGKLVLMTDDEIAEELGDPLGEPRRVTDASQLSEARGAINSDVARAAPALAGSMDVLGPVGEALNNALKHSGSGVYQVHRQDDCVQVRIVDGGPGIDFRNLPKATLVAGFSTTATLGMGFTIMLQLCDRVLLSTQPGSTTLVLEFDTESPEHAEASEPAEPDIEEFERLADALGAR